MTQTELEVDYLIIGAGAMGLAFADTVVAESDKTVAIVDMHHRPGGHWNDAYPFVTLHQPSAYYGVPSRELSKNKKDTEGLNKGLYDLATGPEIMAYFDAVMRETLLPLEREYRASTFLLEPRRVAEFNGNRQAIQHTLTR